MSDESQPNAVLEPQLEPELMDPEPVKPSEDPSDPEPEAKSDAQATSEPESETIIETPVEPAGDVMSADVESEPVADEPIAPPVSAATVEMDDAVSEPTGAPVETEEPVSEPAEAEVEGAVAGSPSVVRIADIEDSEPSTADKVVQSINRFAASMQGRGWVAVVVIAVVFIAFLFLPPISLGQRLADMGGYTTLNAETPSVEHPDGLTVERVDEGEGRIRVRLDSIPRAEFVGDALPQELSGAVAAISERLVPKSPYYNLDVKSDNGTGGKLTVVIPNESEPWETLDLYSWNGEAWTWLPTTLDRDREVLESVVETLPASVMVMQTQSAALHTVAEASTWPLENAQTGALAEVDVSGILIGTMGGTTGDATQLPVAAEGEVMIAPTVRNWLVGREPNWALVSEMLSSESNRNAHVQNLIGLAQSGGYTGIVLDYKSVQPADRAAYTGFVEDLGVAMHDVGLWLAVVVDTPAPGADGWETGGYNWAALGQAADQLRVVMPLDPQAYTPGGQAEQLIQWAVTQVNRQRLMPVYSTMSTDGDQVVALETVLTSVGTIQAQDTLTDFVRPGTSLGFTLGSSVDLAMNAETGATQLTTADASYWLGTPQWLKTKMDLAARHRLNGVVLRHLFEEGNLDGIQDAVASYESGSEVGSYAAPDVTWSVTGPALEKTESKTPLAQPQFVWTAPEVTGTYRIAASVGGMGKGMVSVEVSVPAPVVTETVATDEDAEDEGETDATTAEPEEGDEEAPALQAGFVSDVSVPDNTRFEKGADFTKTWRLRNSGSEPWPESTVLVYKDGAVLSESDEVSVGEVGVGEDVDISVDMVAPDEDGTYRSNWLLQADDATFDGGVVYVQIVVGEPEEETPAPEPDASTPAPAPAPAPVAAGSFELGGHVRDMGLPYKDKMRYAGMNWIKTQIPYGTDASGLVNVAHSNGFKIQLSAIGGPSMVTNPGFEQDFSNWLAGVAATGADAIEVWNEPNIDREWQNGHISPEAYTNLLCTAYNAIKGANPGTAVISAAPAPTGWYGGCGPGGCDDQPWLEGMYNAGAANCMDYIGAHHNAGATSPSARIGHPANPGDPHHSWFFLPQTELYYNIFRGTRQVFYTEMGYASQEGVPTFSDGFGWARGIDNAEQAAWLAEAVQLGINTGMVRCIIVWNIDFVRYGDDPQDGFAIIRPGGGCPACDSLHNVLGSR